MSREYKAGDYVPSPVICARLRELATAVSEGTESVNREFTLNRPVDVARDADMVLWCAAKRIEALEAAIRDTIEENLGLADGDVCTLIRLKRAIGHQ